MKIQVTLTIHETKGGYVIHDSGGTQVAVASGRRSLLARVGELAKIEVESALDRGDGASDKGGDK